MNIQVQLRILWFGAFVSNACFSLIIPFIPMYLYNLGVQENNEFWSSIIIISSYIGATISSPIWGSLADRFGHKAMIVRAGFMNGFIYILCAIVQGPIELVILRLLYGLNSGFMPALNALVSNMSTKENMATNVSSIQNAVVGGQLLGPLIGGVFSSLFSISSSFIIVGISMLINTMCILFLVKNNTTNEKNKRNKQNRRILWDIKSSFKYKGLAVLLMVVFLYQISSGMLLPVLSTYILELEIEKLIQPVILMFNGDIYSFLNGIVFSFPTIVAFFVIKWWAKRGQKVSFYSNIKIGLIMGAMLSSLTTFVYSIGLLIVVRGIQGFFTAGIIPGVSTLIAKNVNEDFRGTAFSLLNSIRSLGSIIGPLMGGVITYLIGAKWVFTGIGLILTISFIILAIDKSLSTTERESVKQVEKIQ